MISLADPYQRFPHLSRDLVTFVAEDDVWLASLPEALSGGAVARRLTDDRVPTVQPRLSPSADRVAWTSTKSFGGQLRGTPREAHVIAVDGGDARQLTYWSDLRTTVCGWLSDEEVLVRSSYGHYATSRTWMFAVTPGAAPRELPYGPALQVSVAADGAIALGTPVLMEMAYWKRYRGGTTARIWLSAGDGKFEPLLPEAGGLDGHLAEPMCVGDRIAFLADHEGVGALYSVARDGCDLRRHTEHGPYYARHASSDGTRVVYECCGRLWLLDSLDAAAVPQRLDIRLAGGDGGRGRASRTIDVRANLGGYGLDATGRFAVIEARGTVHVLPTDGAPAREALNVPGVRARLPVLTHAAAAVVCVTDRGGEEGLEYLPASEAPRRPIGHGQFGRVRELVVSPDDSTAAVATADGRVLVVDLESGRLRELACSENGPCGGLCFSPDSRHLAWEHPWISRGRTQIRVARLADDTVHEVTERRFHDFSPAFTGDGRYLVFLSNRVFDPLYDGQTYDLGFAFGIRPYVAPLRAGDPSPFGPRFGGVPHPDDAVAIGDDAGVDWEQLPARAVPFPVEAGNYAALRAVGDAVAWLDLPTEGVLGEARRGAANPPGTRLVVHGLRSGDDARYTLATGLTDYAVTPDGTRVITRRGGTFTVHRPCEQHEGELDLSGLAPTIDPASEWRQMYEESWRLTRDRFWREDMDGSDWDVFGARYRPLLDRIGSTDDLYDVLCELHGELGTSHTGLFPAPAAGPARRQGFLGVEWGRDGAGGWVIDRVLPGDMAVAAGRSPLLGPGAAARPGDRLLAVDGEPVDPARGPQPLLQGKAEREVELSLARGGERLRVTVVPTASERRLRYVDLVTSRRARTARRSGGRVGYLHVPDLQAIGWADLHRDLAVEFDHDALIVDLRENGGGGIAQLVLEKLTRRVTGWYVARRIEPYYFPFDAPRGAVVGLVDEFATCAAEHLAHSMRVHGMGPLVGTRTWGGVYSMHDAQRLVDGTTANQPERGLWIEGVEWGVENRGITPEIEVVIAPHEAADGADPQLDAAIDAALAALDSQPAATPPRWPAARYSQRYS